MNGPANEDRPELCPADQASAALGSNIGDKNDEPTGCLDNKENLYSISSNRYDLASLPRATTQSRASKKGERNNLRKSIAWNQAFFTDEGILDPSELSSLCGSAAKSSAAIVKEKILGELNGDLTPLKTYEVDTRSINELAEKTPVFKTSSKSMLRAPSHYSVKRKAEINPNPVSKLPKFTASISPPSSVASSARSDAPTNALSLTLKTVKTDEKCKSKRSSLTLKKDKISEHVVKKKVVDEDSCLPPQAPRKQIKSLNTPQNQETMTSFSTKTIEKTETKICRNSENIPCSQKPSTSQPRASGLRMPTPSMGFFNAEKSRLPSQKESKGTRAFALKSQLPRPALLSNARLASRRAEAPISDFTAKAHCMSSAIEPIQYGQSQKTELPNSVGPTKDYRPSRVEMKHMNNSENTNSLSLLSECSKEITQSHDSASSNSLPRLEEPKIVQHGCISIDEHSSFEVDVTATSAIPPSTSENNVDGIASKCASSVDSSRIPKDASTLLNQLRAAPFSEEWIAALETFGEDILQVKSGTVQNSPTQKPNQEPGPWSPVKRKNFDVGPYDCTKYTKNP